VLVVEDDHDLLTFFRVELRGAGYDVRTASDGFHALRELEGFRPDVIVLDLRLPRVSGQDVLAELRNDVTRRSIPVVIVTAMHNAPAPGGQIAATLRKPVSGDQLIAAIEDCLSSSTE
jgi:DNA-binding response OmpR family regulator